MPRHWTIAACLSLCLAAASAQAETPAAFAARGTIVSADAANLTLKEADGTQDSFALAPAFACLGSRPPPLRM
jgi:ABC-type enterochelin transport system substrate-binding protein